jgi:LysM repeat protein
MVQNRLDRAFGGLIREGKDIASLKEHSAKLKETPSRYLRYRVEPGDTPETIARSHNTTVAILAEANGITNRIFIGPGQILLVPQQ